MIPNGPPQKRRRYTPDFNQFGCGTRIRTQTNRVRVCRATLTQFRIAIFDSFIIIYDFIQKSSPLCNFFFRSSKSPIFYSLHDILQTSNVYKNRLVYLSIAPKSKWRAINRSNSLLSENRYATITATAGNWDFLPRKTNRPLDDLAALGV